MLKQNHFSFPYTKFDHIESLPSEYQELIFSAKNALSLAYAPYSNFQVSCAIRLENNQIIVGANQENASFPVGICAERVALSNVAMLQPKESITSIALTYNNLNEDINKKFVLSPCGLCRQSILEKANLQEEPITIILTSSDGSGVIIPDAQQLLPFAFSDF